MKFYFVLLGLFLFMNNGWSQSVAGTWKTIDDGDGTVKSLVSIYEEDGKLYGKILKLMNSDQKTCTACKGDKKDQALEGMQIMWDLKHDKADKWKGGKIMDPNNGKEYKCKIELEDEDTLKVRGFIGFSLLGRTQTWYRVGDK